MSKTKFPHPSAPTIAKTGGTSRPPTAPTSPTNSRHQSCMLVSKASPRAPYPGRSSGKNASGGSAQRRHPPVGGGKSIAAVVALSNSVGGSDSEDDELDEEHVDQKFVLEPVASKRRAGKGGRRAAAGRRPSHTLLDDSEDLCDFPRGGINGPRPIFCVCRQGNLSEEGMLECTDCKELFHGSCVGVSPHTIRSALPPYVCESCIQLDPRRKRIPGTVLGIGSHIAHPSAVSALASQMTSSAGDDDSDDHRVASLPAQSQAALAAFMSAGEAMDDDDICPICEDECTCRNSRPEASVSGAVYGVSSGNTGNDNANDNGDGDGPPMPLFSQIALIDSHPPLQPTKKRESASRKATKKSDTRASKAATKARQKPRAKKGKGSEKTLISHMVEEIGVDGGEYELFGSADHMADATTQIDGVRAGTANSDNSSSDDEYEFIDSQFAPAAPASRSNAPLLPRESKVAAQSAIEMTLASPPLAALSGSQTQLGAKPKAKAQTKSKSGTKAKPNAKSKTTTTATNKRGRPPKTAASAGAGNDSKQKKKQGPASANVEPLVYEVNAAVIRGRDRRPSIPKRGMSPIRAPSEALSGEDDEFINITDFTSDTSAGYPSETEFDLPSTQGEDAPPLASWSDAGSNLLADEEDDDAIEKSEEAYLIQMHENDLSSSSLSDIDEERMAGFHSSRIRAHDIDSGEESDSESNDGEIAGVVRSRRRKATSRKQRVIEYCDFDNISDVDSLSDIGSIGSLASDDESETDQELTFRQARTADERALAEYVGSSDEREDALLNMHLEQLRTVRNVLPDCPSSPLFDAEASGSDALSDVEMEIAFTYHSDINSDDSKDLSDDLMEGWGTDARRRWEADSDSSSDSSLSESKIDRLRLKGDEDDNHSDLYSSDSYDEFYTRSAFLDMNSDDDDVALEDALYPPGMDLDSASLALGVALSMEQQGYSKEDAAAAAAVAAAAYPGANASEGEGSASVLGNPSSTTTITASMNANGEADPIDGIVSIKSSSKTAGATRMATGTHTPFFPSGWRAAAAAAAYLDNQNQPALPYVLPKDLNEARSPTIALAAASAAEAQAEVDAMVAAVVGSEAGFTDRSAHALNGEVHDPSTPGLAIGTDYTESPQVLGGISAATTATAVAPEQVSAKHAKEDTESNYNEDTKDLAASKINLQPQSASVTSFTSQLRNSSFYKPLSSICSPIRRAASSSAVSQHPLKVNVLDEGSQDAQQSVKAISTDIQQERFVEPAHSANSGFIPGAPLVSLAEVNAALSVLAENSTPGSPVEYSLPFGIDSGIDGSSKSNILKRKMSDNSIAAGSIGDDKRVRGDISFVGSPVATDVDIGDGFAPIDMSMLLATSSDSCSAVSSIPAAIACPGTPQRANPMLAMGAGTPIRGSMGPLGDGHETESDMEDWLMTMDQLVDTDALMIKSPPPTPAEGLVADLGPEISRQLSSIGVLGSRRSDSVSSNGGGIDMLSRWDRIPVNIFRRSRALASNNRRGIMVSQDDMMGTMSSLALTAIKSSRQRRALVNTTLLAQHTLPAEAALQQQAFKHAMRSSSNNSSSSRRASQMHRMSSLAMMAPPPPPPTPLSQIAGSTQKQALAEITVSTAKEGATHKKSNASFAPEPAPDTGSGASAAGFSSGGKASAFSPVNSLSDLQDGPHHHRQLSFSGNAISDAESDSRLRNTPGQQSDHLKLDDMLSRSDQMQPQSAGGNAAHKLESQMHSVDPVGSIGHCLENAQASVASDTQMSGVDNGSDSEYAFGWLEDEEDLALFAMPGMQAADVSGSSFQEPPSLTMMLASAAPMLMPYRTKSGNGGDAGSDTHI
ncbi:hypothetical protein FB645_002930 [Coemansia sp. IMI 203386]|nr:hypothetical protein FB645_002930 [Coemansia sp. IMI 203386]